ncbi:hypothetical protein M2128_001337 [Polynucleobacter sphagniphilus]|uniref:hypothetical protein n=1 Tax=Polynucleobacter sphagniphilus TaxID=1743169 RepID=UPI0024757059|nr:hypothetical protein [Polynucleobacter sphagniphilus]MDH6302416.1 hypothetical protein [Polynucleobacter sphagniphilus]
MLGDNVFLALCFVATGALAQTNEPKGSLSAPPVVGKEAANPANVTSLFASVSQGNTPKIYTKGPPSGSAVVGRKAVSTGGEVYITNQDLKVGQYVKPVSAAQAGTINLQGRAQIFASNIVIDAAGVNIDGARLVTKTPRHYGYW